MTTAEKAKMVETLVRENRDITIGEYLEVLRDIERVEKSLKPITETWPKSSHYRGDFPQGTQKQDSPQSSLKRSGSPF